MKKLFIAFNILCFFTLFSLNAQRITISGSVWSGINKSPLISANVVLRGVKNNISASAIADLNGNFELRNIRASQDYSLEISYVGFKTYKKAITNPAADIELGKILLEQEAKSLEEVNFIGKEPLAVMKGDTLQYNSSAYKTNPDATAEDLAKKMPGIEISGNDVKAQGESVKKVTVDGKPFFDQDASLTLKSLPAAVIDKIEIFDEQSEQSRFTGFDDGNTSKTMNIVTHSRMRTGTFGRFYAGYGPDGYYQAGASYNIFKGARRVSLLGMTNNINVQNFSSEDFLGTSSGGGGGRSGGGNNFNMGNQSGLTKTNAFGINYSDTWGKKITVTGSYFFNNKSSNDTQTLQQNFFGNDMSGKVYNESQNSSSTNNNHRMNMRLEYKIDSSNTLLFIPRVSFQGNNSNSGSSAQNLLDAVFLNRSNSNINSDRSGVNIINDILYSHSFAKKGRTLSLSLGGSYSNQTGNTWQNSLTEFFGPTGYSDSIDNFTDNKTLSRSYSSRLSWTEPFSKRSSVIINFGNSIKWNSSDKQTYDQDLLTEKYTIRDTLLSNVFESKYNSSSAGLGYRFADGKLTWISSVDYEYSTLTANRLFPMEVDLNHNYVSILPSSMLRFDFSKTTRLRIFYRTNTSSPTVSQLQDVPDTRNPLQISVGNAALKPSWQQNMFARFSRTNPSSATTFFLLFGGGTTNNFVANSIFIANSDTLLPGDIKLSKGARLTRPVNMDGSRNLRSFLNYGIPISAIKTNLNINLSWTYNRIPGMLNGREGFSNNNISGFGIVLSSNISEKIDFTVSSNSSYNHTVSTLEKNQTSEYFNQRTGIAANLIFWKGIVFNTDMSHQYYSGLSSKFSNNYLLWNLALAKKVFKDQSGEFKFSVYDILKQNTSYNRTVTESYIQDSQNRVLGQYFMFTFTYKLRNFKGTESGNQRMWEPGMGANPGYGPPSGEGHPPGLGPGMRPDHD